MNIIVNYLITAVVCIVGLLLSLIENIVELITPRSIRRKSIHGKIALITGGGSGVGRGVAIRLADCGAKVIVWDVNAKGNEETKEIIKGRGHQCATYTVDLCDRKEIYRVADEVKKDFGKVDILFNNAGVVTGKSFLDCTDEQILRTFDVNILSYMFTIKAFLPGMMKENNGQIINMGSVASFSGVRKQSDYSSSKFALLGFHETLVEELHKDGYNGIDLTFVATFYIDTGMFKGSSSGILQFLKTDDVCDEIVDAILMKRAEVIMPWILARLIFLKRFLTPTYRRMVMYSFGFQSSMDTFIGRNPRKTELEINKAGQLLNGYKED